MFDQRKNENDQEEMEVTNELEESDEPDLEEVEANSQQKIKELRDKLKVCDKEKMQHLEDLQRLKADYLNSKRRLEEERAQDKERLADKFIESLLPLCDSFRSAMQSQAWQNVDDTWKNGVNGIFSQLQSILQSYNVIAIDPTGQPFDPNTHEAMGTTPVEDESKHDTVTEVVQLGYARTKDGEERIIRPARVLVGNFT